MGLGILHGRDFVSRALVSSSYPLSSHIVCPPENSREEETGVHVLRKWEEKYHD